MHPLPSVSPSLLLIAGYLVVGESAVYRRLAYWICMIPLAISVALVALKPSTRLQNSLSKRVWRLSESFLSFFEVGVSGALATLGALMSMKMTGKLRHQATLILFWAIALILVSVGGG